MSNSLKEFSHFDLLFPGRYLKAGDLRGQEVTVIIADIEPRHELVGAGGRKDMKPLLHLRTPSGRKIERAMICNVTNGRRIMALYGPEVTGWIGKAIILCAEPEPKSASGEAIRVKEALPKLNGKKSAKQDPVEGFDPDTGEVHEESWDDAAARDEAKEEAGL